MTEVVDEENLERVTTTFWMDFTIAEIFGEKAIRETYSACMEGWKDNYKYLTELVMVLNHKAWTWSEKDEGLTKLYIDLYEKTHDYACANLKGEEITYYFYMTD